MAPGQVVSKGQDIALVGGDPGDLGRGSSTGAHVHFHVTKDGIRLRPDSEIEWEDGVDKDVITNALNVVWGYAELLEKPPGLKRTGQKQAAKELKDAVVAIKQEAGID